MVISWNATGICFRFLLVVGIGQSHFQWTTRWEHSLPDTASSEGTGLIHRRRANAKLSKSVSLKKGSVCLKRVSLESVLVILYRSSKIQSNHLLKRW